MDTRTVCAKMDQYIALALAQACEWTFDVEGLRTRVPLKHRRKAESKHLLQVSLEEENRRLVAFSFPIFEQTEGKTRVCAPRMCPKQCAQDE